MSISSRKNLCERLTKTYIRYAAYQIMVLFSNNDVRYIYILSFFSYECLFFKKNVFFVVFLVSVEFNYNVYL